MQPFDALFLFDIDGTLVEVAEGIAFTHAFAELYGDGVDLSWPQDVTASDMAFFAAVVERIVGREAAADEVARALDRFVSHLETGIVGGTLPIRPIAGASEFVARCAATNAVAIATGCVEPSARVKLRHAGLAHHFPCGGFSHRETRRADIVQRAIAAAEHHYGRRFAPAQIVSFGDGPWDVEAAHELGLHFVGINETERGRERLARAGATMVYRDFTEAESIVGQLTLSLQL